MLHRTSTGTRRNSASPASNTGNAKTSNHQAEIGERVIGEYVDASPIIVILRTARRREA
jgi:hypothetical protein